MLKMYTSACPRFNAWTNWYILTMLVMGVVSLVTIHRRSFQSLTARNKRKFPPWELVNRGTTWKPLMLSFLKRFEIDTLSYRDGHLNFGALFVKVALFEEKKIKLWNRRDFVGNKVDYAAFIENTVNSLLHIYIIFSYVLLRLAKRSFKR